MNQVEQIDAARELVFAWIGWGFVVLIAIAMAALLAAILGMRRG